MLTRVAIVVPLAFLACNKPPEGLDVALGPDAATTVDDIVVEILTEATDPNAKDEVILETAWSVDGVEQEDLAGALLVPAARTAAGQIWSVEVVATDGRKPAEAIRSEITIANTAPTLALSLSKGSVLTDEDLVASAQTEDVDGDDVSITWSWTVDGVDAGWAEPTVPAERTTRGQVWQVTAIASDGIVDSEAQRGEVTVGNTVPSVGAARVSPQRVYETDIVSCIGGGWRDADGDPEAFEYSWRVNGREVATTQTLDGALFDRGDELSCRLTPIDDASSGETVESGSVVVRNSLAYPTFAELTPADPTIESVLETEVGSVFDADGDFAVVIFTWFINGEAIEHSSSFMRPWEHGVRKGDEVKVWMRGFDGTDRGEGPARTVTILNTPPSTPGIELSEADGYAHCAISEGSVDPDLDDSISYSFAWEHNGVAWAGAVASLHLPGDAIDLDDVSGGDSLRCTVTPTDDDDVGVGATADMTTSIE